ncbi:zinc-binding dehydrogenase [Kribbella sp. NPDC026596]|uniref:zinc-binding dehydrogenase n=1 Tax=Kribbella sp. NPDC026596 TaxID=3155122 RepID=UPI0033F210B7
MTEQRALAGSRPTSGSAVDALGHARHRGPRCGDRRGSTDPADDGVRATRGTGRIVAGDTVLIHAAAGGVGTVAAQLARALGADGVLGTVGSLEKISYAEQSGYDSVFLREGFSGRVREFTGRRGVNLVLDPVGGPVRAESIELLAPFGRLAAFGVLLRS